jgi:hypothetical protein
MMTRSLLFSGLALVLSVASLAAQRPGGNVDEKVQEMRRQVIEGRVIQSHVRVSVRLKNGNRIRGIVKNGFLVERVDGLRFVSAEKDEEGAGLRVYYWNGRNNFVFLPFDNVQSYKVGERLSAVQLAAIERESRQRADASEKDREAAQRAQPSPAGETAGTRSERSRSKERTKEQGADADTPAADEPVSGEPFKQTAEVQQLYKLVQDYPPASGWGVARRDEIKRRIAVVGAKPSPAELRFVAKFDEWQQACQMFGVDVPAPTDVGQSRRRRPRR